RVEPVFALIDRWADAATQALFAADAARTESIRGERAEAANRYFAGHAEVWDQIRSLHVAESEVERAIGNVLGGRPLGRLVDIGTGTGRMIELFGPRSSHAIGIDRSSEMLRLARVKLEAAGIQSSLRPAARCWWSISPRTTARSCARPMPTSASASRMK